MIFPSVLLRKERAQTPATRYMACCWVWRWRGAKIYALKAQIEFHSPHKLRLRFEHDSRRDALDFIKFAPRLKDSPTILCFIHFITQWFDSIPAAKTKRRLGEQIDASIFDILTSTSAPSSPGIVALLSSITEPFVNYINLRNRNSPSLMADNDSETDTIRMIDLNDSRYHLHETRKRGKVVVGNMIISFLLSWGGRATAPSITRAAIIIHAETTRRRWRTCLRVYPGERCGTRCWRD